MSETGTITATNDVDVYGLQRNSTGSSDSRHKFVGGLGHTTDTETGLIYMRARYYDPAIGRFISEDPAGDGVNWFVYCGNNPVNAIDSDGKNALHNIAFGLGTAFTVFAIYTLWSVRNIPVCYVTEPCLMPAFWQAVSFSQAAIGLFAYAAYGIESPSYAKTSEIAAGVLALTGIVSVMCRGTAAGMKTAAAIAVGAAFGYGLYIASMYVLTDVL